MFELIRNIISIFLYHIYKMFLYKNKVQKNILKNFFDKFCMDEKKIIYI